MASTVAFASGLKVARGATSSVRNRHQWQLREEIEKMLNPEFEKVTEVLESQAAVQAALHATELDAVHDAVRDSEQGAVIDMPPSMELR